MAVDAINHNNPFFVPVIQPKTGEKQAPAINPFAFSPLKVRPGEWTGFEQVLAGVNKNPYLSCFPGKYGENTPLGKSKAISLGNGKIAGENLYMVS